MEPGEIVLRRMAGQHLLKKSDTLTVARDLCGIQAQFLSHAIHALKIRCNRMETDGLVKNWTNRGTMHLFAQEDLPLFMHASRTHFLRPADTMAADEYVNAERKRYFAAAILDAVANGIDEREALKEVCSVAGMTENEEKSLFDPWGGIIRALCEEGKLCHKVQEKKAYQLCPEFEPMEAETAWVEKAQRYFMHYGPATVKDAAYFFGVTQAQVKQWLKQLPVQETEYAGRKYYYLDGGIPEEECPPCLFLAGFDQMMLGYDKKESIMLRQENIRDVFTMAGIVRPVVLINGTAAGVWKKKNEHIEIRLFASADREVIIQAAQNTWNETLSVDFI